jgi:squalene synthase HpnC
MISALDPGAVARVDELSREFLEAKPFRHVVIEPFLDLLVAFRRDQRVNRYETFDDLLDYCRYSANPVGHLVLYVGEGFDAESAQLSDLVCTGLQLANFWQGVAGDYDRGRIYVPRSSMSQVGYDEEMFARREYNQAFRRMLEREVDRAESLLRAGWPLVDRVPGRLKLDVALFIQGGLSVLRAIQAAQYNVWAGQPSVSKFRKAYLLAQCLWRTRFGKAGMGS